MVQTVMAAGDLMTAIPSFWNDLRVPLGIVVIIGGTVAGIMKLTHGIAKAGGLIIGGFMLAALVWSGPSIAMSIKHTLDRHTGGATTGVSQYGQ